MNLKEWWSKNEMDKYISKLKIDELMSNAYKEGRFVTGYDYAILIEEFDNLPATDVQPVDKITKIIEARLNGVQKVKIDAMLSGDSNTAYKMVGAEMVCNAILQDLEAIKG